MQTYFLIDRLLDGVFQVIEETFLFPEHFSDEVRIEHGDVVFDLGANIGLTALLFSRMAGQSGRVIAIEPVTPDLITKNMDANAVGNVTVLPVAISDREGETEIEISDFCLDSSIANREYSKDYYSQKKKVPLTRLDDVVNQLNLDKVDFIKMDIEGAEELALKGAKRLIERFRPEWSISSYHIDFENEAQHPKLLRLLKQYGYRVKEHEKSHIFAW